MAQPLTGDDLRAYVNALLAVRDLIRDLGRPIPSGELYAKLMGHMDINVYQHMISSMLEAKVITLKNNVITWTGPRPM